MNKTLNFILFLISTLCFGQNHEIKSEGYFDKIELGYSTVFDVKLLYENLELIELKTLDCPYTDDCSSFYGYNKSIKVPEKGIVFQTDSKTGEIINKIFFYESFKGVLNDSLNIELGNTTVKQVYHVFPKSKLTSTNRKKYWIIENDNFSFLVNRLESDNEYPIKPNEIYNREIKSFILNKKESYETDNCSIPVFAPKIEEHENCLIRKHKGGISYISWGGEPTYELVKNGFWKEYYPNHIIKEQGNYIDGVKVGVFEYFNKNGELTETKNHFAGYFELHKWKIIIGILMILIVILKSYRNKNR